MIARAVIAALASFVMLAGRADAQTSTDTLDLASLQGDALRRDPRARSFEILAGQSALRLRNLRVEWLPAVTVNARSQYQSDVLHFPVTLPGLSLPTPSRDMHDAWVQAAQRVFDPTTRGRERIELAQLAESQARLHASLYSLRQSVNEAYFGALELEAQERLLSAATVDLEAQLRLVTDRVRAGSALPGDATTIEAELLRRRQTIEELRANRIAALEVLAHLTGRDSIAMASLSIPSLEAATAAAVQSVDTLRRRPEYRQFDRTRETLAAQRSAFSARELPRVSAFGRAGYGKPGLDPLSREFDPYWVAGIQLEWSPWTWGATSRQRQELELQQRIVDNEEHAFTDALRRAATREAATIARLSRALGEDEQIIRLREQALREARLRLGEGVITSAEYVDRETDLLLARRTLEQHGIQLAAARARLLASLGVELP